MLRSAQRARLEARTALLQGGFRSTAIFFTASFRGATVRRMARSGLEPLSLGVTIGRWGGPTDFVCPSTQRCLVLSSSMDTRVFQLALKRFKALDARQFDRSFMTREEALDDVSRFPESHMAPSQDLRRRYRLSNAGSAVRI